MVLVLSLSCFLSPSPSFSFLLRLHFSLTRTLSFSPVSRLSLSRLIHCLQSVPVSTPLLDSRIALEMVRESTFLVFRRYSLHPSLSPSSTASPYFSATYNLFPPSPSATRGCSQHPLPCYPPSYPHFAIRIHRVEVTRGSHVTKPAIFD